MVPVEGASDSKSDVVLLARLKQVARLWVTQLDQEAQHEAQESPEASSHLVKQLLKIIQDEQHHYPNQMIAKDAREGMVVTLKYWHDLILLRRSFNRQMVLQNEQDCTQNLNHWLQHCVGKKERETTPSPVGVAQFEPLLATPPVSPPQTFGTVNLSTGVVRKPGAAVSPGGETDTRASQTTTTVGAASTHRDNDNDGFTTKDFAVADIFFGKKQQGGTEEIKFLGESIAQGRKSNDDADGGLKPAASQDQGSATVYSEESMMMRSHNTLVALYHGKHCTSRKSSPCTVFPHCTKAKALWKHVSECSVGDTCRYEHCAQSQSIMQHYLSCQRPSCIVCGPVIMVLPRLKKDIDSQAKHKPPSPKAKSPFSERSSPNKRESPTNTKRGRKRKATLKPCNGEDAEEKDEETYFAAL